MLRSIAFILFLFTGPFYGVAEGSVNVDEVVSTLPFEIHRGLMLLQVEVEGQEKTFLLDSGAPSVVLNRKVRNSQTLFTCVEGDIPAVQGKLRELKIGNILRTQVPIWSMDLSHIEEKIGAKIDGLIGADILSSYDLLIDYKLQKVSFLASDKLNEVKPSFSRVVALPFVAYFDNLPVVEVRHEGKKLKMGFDTGAGVSVISESLIDGKKDMLHEISLGPLKVQSMPFVGHSDMSQFVDKAGNQLDGILSVTSLNADFVLISTSRKSIYLFWEEVL